MIAMKKSPASRQVAEHYVKARAVPATQVIYLDETPQKPISRIQWETKTRPFLRRWLVEHGLAAKIRCFVTVFDVPLLIDRRDPQSPAVQDRLNYLKTELAQRLEQSKQIIRSVEGLQREPKQEAAKLDEDAKGADLARLFEAELKKAQQRVQAVRETPEGKSASAALDRLYLAAGGAGILARNLAKRSTQQQLNPEWNTRLEFLKGQLQGLSFGYAALENLPDGVERDQQALALVQQIEGVLGSVLWIEQQLSLLESNETYASFDSELSLLYWPGYPLLRWQPNVLHHLYDQNPIQRSRYTVMVSRLEAPSVERTLTLIDTALKVEKTGLKGKVYLDARATPASTQRGSTGEYDESIRTLAKLVKDKTSLTVVLDDKSELFQPGSCPDAALYCGWYSLANYVDAFRWAPGAVGYHMASGEAVTLRDPQNKAWCPQMLERGVIGTLGPVREPYLSAFPRPDEFFPLLLTGKFTLVECYYRTLPFSSWVMVLVGDPLYTPFAATPALKMDDLPASLRPRN